MRIEVSREPSSNSENPLDWGVYLAGTRRLGGRHSGQLLAATLFEERESIWLRFQFETIETPRSETRLYDCRHDSLLFFGWLIDGWPKSLGASIGREMLWRGLNRPRNRLGGADNFVGAP